MTPAPFSAPALELLSTVNSVINARACACANSSATLPTLAVADNALSASTTATGHPVSASLHKVSSATLRRIGPSNENGMVQITITFDPMPIAVLITDGAKS